MAKRRDVLAGTGVALAAAVAGCLSQDSGTGDDGADDSNDGGTRTDKPEGSDPDESATTPGPDESRTYEECSREVIPYDQFPAEIQAEIDAALDDAYEADHVFLQEAMDTDRSFVSVDDEYYEARVTVEDGTERLELDLVDPKVMPRPRPIDVALEYGTERTITIELVADDGTILAEGSRSLYEGSEVEFGETNRVGIHDIHVTVADGETVETETTETVTINESRFSIIVVVEEDGLTISGAVADLGVCQYDD